jgi:hypothetical protein
MQGKRNEDGIHKSVLGMFDLIGGTSQLDCNDFRYVSFLASWISIGQLI